MSNDRQVKQGQEFATVLLFEKEGAAVSQPESGPHLIAMRPGVRFAGHAEKALKILEAAFPGCTFAWKPAASEPSQDTKKKRK